MRLRRTCCANICRLAPLYLDVLDTLGMRPNVVLTVRHPVEVIRSIGERDDVDPATIELLWLRHVLEAETASRLCRRVWTSYDQLLRSWEPTVKSIASGLDIIWLNEPEYLRPEIEEFLRPRHRHYQIDKDPDPPHLGQLTTRAWEAVQLGLDGNEMAAQKIFDEVNTTITEIDRMNLPCEESFQKQLSAVETERNDLRHRLANSEASLSEIRALFAPADEKRAQLENSEIAHRNVIARLSEIGELKLANLRAANDLKSLPLTMSLKA